MNPEEKVLEVIVAGQMIGIIKMKSYQNITDVIGDGIIPTGNYQMSPREIERMVSKKLIKENIEIRNLGKFKYI